MIPRIERHEATPEDLTKATADFHDRIAGDVHMQQHGGRDGFGWAMIANDLHAYAAARSATTPHAEADIKAALRSAAETRLGALMLDCPPSDVELSVFVSYTGTGYSYGPLAEEDEFGNTPHGERPASAHDWRETMYLAIITGQQGSYEGPLINLASHFEEDRVLERALTHYVYPQLGAEREQLEGYVGAALEPFFAAVAQRPDDDPELGTPRRSSRTRPDRDGRWRSSSASRTRSWRSSRASLSGLPGPCRRTPTASSCASGSTRSPTRRPGTSANSPR